MDACDPKLDIENLRQMIKQNTGKDLKLSRKKICQAYTDIQEDNLPLPPLVLSRNRTFMVDAKSPLKQKDYDTLFASDSKVSDLKRVAKKAGVALTDGLTKSELVDATKRYLDGRKIREPIVLARKRHTSVSKVNVNTNVNNTNVNRVNNVNNVNTNRVNNVNNVNTNQLNTNRVNVNTNQVNRGNTFPVNRVNTNRVNVNTNRVNRGNTFPVNRVNTNRVNRGNAFRKNATNVSFPKSVNIAAPARPVSSAPAPSAPSAPTEASTRVSFPSQVRPKLNASKPSFINAARARETKTFIPSKTFVPNKPGYVFTTGQYGLGMYRNTQAVEGPQLPNSYVPPTQNINDGMTKVQAIQEIKSLGIKRESNFLANLNSKNAKYANVVTRARVQKGNEDELIKYINATNLPNAKKSEFKNKIAMNSLNAVRRQVDAAQNAPNGPKANNGPNAPKANNGPKIPNAPAPPTANNLRLGMKKMSIRSYLRTKNVTPEQVTEIMNSITVNTNVENVKRKINGMASNKSVNANVPNAPKPSVPGRPTPNNLQVGIKKMAIKAYIRNKRLTPEQVTEIMNGIRSNTNVDNMKRRIDEMVLNIQNNIKTPNAPKTNRTAQFTNYLNTVNELSNENKKTLINDGSITNLNALRTATNKLVANRKNEKKSAMKLQVTEFLNTVNLSVNEKNNLMRRYNSNELTFNGLKNEVKKIANIKDMNTKIKNKQSLLNFLNTNTSLNQVTKNALVRDLNAGNTVAAIQNKARQLDQQQKNARVSTIKNEINAYMTNKSLTNDEKRSFVNRVNANTNITALKANINTRSQASNNQKKTLNRQNLNGHIASLGLTNQERQTILSKFNANGSNLTALKNEATAIRNSKKATNRTKLTSTLNATGLNQTQKNTILNKFNKGIANVESLQSEIQELVKIKNDQNRVNTRNGLKTYMNSTNLMGENKNAFLKELNAGESNVNTIKRKITNLINSRIKNQQNKNRADLVEYLNTLDLTEPNKAKIMQNFGNALNVNRAKTNAKTLANQRRTEKFEANKSKLREYVAGMNINATQILADFNTGALSLNAAINKARQLANSKVVERRAANRKTLENHINQLGLETNEKNMLLKNFNDDSGNLNTLMKTANNIRGASNKRKLNMERQKVKNALNAMNLTNINRVDLMRQFNEGARNVEQKAIQMIENKRVEKLNGMKTQMKEYLNYIGASNEDKNYIMNKITSVNANVNALRNEAKKMKNKRNINARTQERQTLTEYINSIGLASEDKSVIMNKFNTTNASLNTLRTNANDIAKSRKQEKYVTNKASLEKHMNTLGLNNTDRIDLLSKLNSPSINVKNIINQATNMSIRRKEEKRAKNRSELKNYVNTLELLNDDREYVMKLFDDEQGNVEAIKKQGRNLVNTRKTEKTEALKMKFKSYINAMPLNQSNKNVLIQNFNANVNKNVNVWSKKANTLLNQRKSEWKAKDRNELNAFMGNLNLPGNTKLTILKNFDNGVGTLNNLKNRSQGEAKRISEEKKASKRAELSNYLETIGLNPTDRNGFLQKFDNAPNTTNTIKQNAKTTANSIKKAKRNANLDEFGKYITRIGLSNANKNALMQSLTNTNVSLENMKVRANGVLKNRIAEKRTEFSTFLGGLELSNANKNTILKQFDNDSSNVANLEKRATNLVNQRKREKRTGNRNALSNYVKNLTLNQTNKNAILKEFNNSMAELNVMRIKANALVEQRKREFINSKRAELNNYTNTLNLSGEDKNAIMSKFNAVNGNITALKNEAQKLSNKRKLEKIAMNRKELTNMFNTLNLTNTQKTDLLKKFNSGSDSLNVIKTEASNMNANAKAKAATRANVRAYLNSLELNNSVKNTLVKKLNDGSSTANAIKNEATKLNANRRAELLNAKKDELREYMTNKNLTNTERNAFIARVTNKNMNLASIKQEISNVNTASKKRKQESANRASKLNAFLNTLNLTNDNKKTFKNQLLVNNTNTTLNTIKTRATNMNTERKKIEANRKRQEERSDLEKHLKNMVHLTNVDMQKYVANFNAGGSLQNLKNASKKNNEDRLALKETLKKQITNAPIPDERKQQYMNQLNKPYVNINLIQTTLNKNISNTKAIQNQLKKNVATQLQALNTLEKANRTVFMNRLNVNGANKVLANAKNMNAQRRQAKQNAINKIQALTNLNDNERKNFINALDVNGAMKLNTERKDKKARNNVSTQLQAFNNLENNNRKTLMNRLNVNGANKVLTNAKDMNTQRKQIKKNATNKIQALTYLNDNERTKFINALDVNGAMKLNTDKRKKNVAGKLQALNKLEKANRTAFMNRLNKGENSTKILANAAKMNSDRRKFEVTRNVAAKLQAKKELERDNRKKLMNNLGKGKSANNVLKNANALILEKTRTPLFDKIIKEIPGKTGVFRRDWEGLVRKATTKEELNAINAQLDEKIKLREEVRASNISDKEKAGHEAWIMKRGNDISKRRQELEGQLKAKKNAVDARKKNVATQLQALSTLEKANRTAFMNRLNKGNSQNTILANATKMNQNRRDAEKKQAEKNRLDQLRKNTAKLLQNKTKLTRDNRKKFMNRLEKGEDPNVVLKEANKLNSDRLTREGVEWKLKQIKGLTSKDVEAFMKRWNTSKNKTIFNDARQLVKNRESGFSFNNANRPNKKVMTPAERFNTNAAGNAKKEIRAMTGMGVKNRNRFVGRIDKGEVPETVLKEARERNKKGASAKSKTVKNLEYKQTVKNVVRRL